MVLNISKSTNSIFYWKSFKTWAILQAGNVYLICVYKVSSVQDLQVLPQNK